MIVRPSQHWFLALFSLRGSVLPNIFSRLVLNLVAAIVAIISLPYYDHLGVHLTTAPFSLLGIAIAIFLGFRTNTGYARFNEARVLWGTLLITARSMTRQIKSLSTDDADVTRIAHFLSAFSWSLKHQLRGTDATSDMARLLPESSYAEIMASPLRTNRLLLKISEWLGAQYQQGKISDIIFVAIDKNLAELAHIQGACERISNTPVPYAYSLILKRTIYIFCSILPFALVDDLHYLTPFVSVFISYTFLSLESVAEEIEDPFGTAPNDLALDAICTTIEINLLEMSDSHPLPPFLSPDQNFQLT